MQCSNVATVPFVGSQKKAMELKFRMTQNTHKHHIYVLPCLQSAVPLGPYESMDKVRQNLQQASSDNILEGAKPVGLD